MKKTFCLLMVGFVASSLYADWVVDSTFEDGLDGWSVAGNVSVQTVDDSQVLRGVSYGTDLWETSKTFDSQTNPQTVFMFDYKAGNIDNGKVGVSIKQGEWPWAYMIDVRFTMTTITIDGVDYAADNSAWQTMEFTFDFGARTYDVLLGDQGGSLGVLADDVDMNTSYSVSSITSVRFREEPAATRSTFYIDNVKVGTSPVPEPATMCLAGLGLGFVFCRKRK